MPEITESSNLLVFLVYVAVVSISGVMQPGPVTAATLAAGTRSRHAGALIALGHGIVEFPLMFLIMAGMGLVFQIALVRIGIGLVGGGFLVFMGVQMVLQSTRSADPAAAFAARNPLWVGVVLTANNPYFLLWWASVGLALATKAMSLGSMAFCLFTVVHWTCDLVWLWLLSIASFEGSRLLGPRLQRAILVVCGIALVGLGLYFIWDAAWFKRK